MTVRIFSRTPVPAPFHKPGPSGARRGIMLRAPTCVAKNVRTNLKNKLLRLRRDAPAVPDDDGASTKSNVLPAASRPVFPFAAKERLLEVTSWRDVIRPMEDTVEAAPPLPSTSGRDPKNTYSWCEQLERPLRHSPRAISHYLWGQNTPRWGGWLRGARSANTRADFTALYYWSLVAVLCDTPSHQTRAFFESASPKGDKTELLEFDIGSCGQRVVTYVDHTNKRVTVSIRGTKNLTNVKTNLKARKSEFLGGVRVHKGFQEVAAEIETYIAPHLRPEYTVFFTGHSAGGVLAVLLAMRWDSLGYRVGKVVSFGAPKVGSHRLVEVTAHLPIVRVAENSDVIPLLPPSTRHPARSRFYHVGEPILVDEDKPHLWASPNAEAKLMERVETVPHVVAKVLRTEREKLQCHRMVRYVRSLERLSEWSQEVAPVELRGYTLASNLKSRRIIQIPFPHQKVSVAAMAEESSPPSELSAEEDAVSSGARRCAPGGELIPVGQRQAQRVGIRWVKQRRFLKLRRTSRTTRLLPSSAPKIGGMGSSAPRSVNAMLRHSVRTFLFREGGS